METVKWDGVTDSIKILEALLLFVDDEDLAIGKVKSYGDFGRDLKKKHMNNGINRDDYGIFARSDRIEVTVNEVNKRYTLTWNKAAKLLHKYLHEEGK